MKFEKVTIRQIPDDYAAMTGLHKHGRSKMPKTIEFLQAAINSDGRFVTGLDEDALEINNLRDPEEREQRKVEILELRRNLERLTQKDLSATSPYWETFGVYISADSDLVLNRSNPVHQIMYHLLIANRYAAPDKDAAALPQFRNAKYVCFVSERADEEAAVDKLAKARISAKLLELFDNPDLMVLIGQYLEGDKYKTGMTPKTLFNMLSAYAENPRDPENAKRFTKAAALGVEDLQFKITVDRAIKKKIIRYRDGYYQRGQVTLGKTPSDVLQNLRKPDYATEFLSIQEELDD